MTHDDNIVFTPWLEATVLREDWQVVAANKEYNDYVRTEILDELRKTL